jgi:hypothetical protein
MRIRPIVLLLLLSASLVTVNSFASDQKPVVRGRADRRIVLIGDRIKYTLDVNYKNALQVKLPDFKDGKIGDFEIKDSCAAARTGLFGSRRMTGWYVIAAYDVGKKEIPAVEIKYRKAGAREWSSLKSAPLNIEVRSVLSATGTPNDIKDIKGPFGFFEINWWLVGVIIVALAVITFFLIKKLRRKVPVRLPHETALEELEAARGDFLKGGGVKEYYVGVSDCIRRYIERVFRLRAPEMTTEEFLASLGDMKALSMEEKGLLREFLNACDLVKFAKYMPIKKEADVVYDTARKFIEETKNNHAYI